jgi:predicted alpha/beta-hydrolase family hydrolase
MGNLAKTWVVGGHSMGGAAASMYMAKPEANPAFRGMMFLARCASVTYNGRSWRRAGRMMQTKMRTRMF